MVSVSVGWCSSCHLLGAHLCLVLKVALPSLDRCHLTEGRWFRLPCLGVPSSLIGCHAKHWPEEGSVVSGHASRPGSSLPAVCVLCSGIWEPVAVLVSWGEACVCVCVCVCVGGAWGGGVGGGEDWGRKWSIYNSREKKGNLSVVKIPKQGARILWFKKEKGGLCYFFLSFLSPPCPKVDSSHTRPHNSTK